MLMMITIGGIGIAIVDIVRLDWALGGAIIRAGIDIGFVVALAFVLKFVVKGILALDAKENEKIQTRHDALVASIDKLTQEIRLERTKRRREKQRDAD